MAKTLGENKYFLLLYTFFKEKKLKSKSPHSGISENVDIRMTHNGFVETNLKAAKYQINRI